MQRPNILLVLTDQQTLGAMSCAGRSSVHTPHMDRLAAEGVRFARSYCTSPVCGPSRASLVTGVTPSRHGLIYNHDPRYQDHLPGRLPTIADQLKTVGYQPYWIGKWHAQEFYPTEEKDVHGFHYLPIEPVEEMGLGLAVDQRVTDRALQFLAEAPEQPWFLGVSWHNPHDICFSASDQKVEALDPVTSQGTFPLLPHNFEISPDEPAFITDNRQRDHYGAEQRRTVEWNEQRWREYLRAYDRLTEAVDAELGRLLAGLERQGVMDDTLIIFTSDHGEGVAGHRLVVKLSPYEEAISVPLIARWPQIIPAGEVCSTHLASGLDLLPTFGEVAGAPVPDGAKGQSLLPQLENPELPGRGYAVVELAPDPQQPDRQARILVTKQNKFMAFSHGDPSEAFYHLAEDPGETRNRLLDEEQAAQVDACRQQLLDWLEENGDDFRWRGAHSHHGSQA